MHYAQKVNSFVKLESYDQYKYARWINSRGDRFKAWAGPLFKSIEMVVYQDRHFIKHVPIPDRPELVKGLIKGSLRYFNTDFTAFEKHFVEEIQENIEFVLYDELLKSKISGADLRYLHKVLTGENHLKMRLGAIANLKARRMSGEMCTSLGNGFTNLMLALFIASKKNGHIDGFVEGDDGIFACDFEMTKEDYVQLGFEIKIIELASPCEASFCGMVFSESGEIIKSPLRVLESFGWTHSFIDASEKIMLELLRAKSLSLVYEVPQCPILGALGREALKRTRGVVPRFVPDGYHTFEHVPKDEKGFAKFDPKPDTRVLFEKVYHIGVSEQLYLESLIQSNDLQGCFDALRFHCDIYDYAARYVLTIPGG